MPKPCVECGGVEEHTIKPFCPSMLRGGGSRRDLCDNMYPKNHGFNRCRKPKGHEEIDPICFFDLSISDGSYYKAECLYQDAIHPIDHERYENEE